MPNSGTLFGGSFNHSKLEDVLKFEISGCAKIQNQWMCYNSKLVVNSGGQNEVFLKLQVWKESEDNRYVRHWYKNGLNGYDIQLYTDTSGMIGMKTKKLPGFR